MVKYYYILCIERSDDESLNNVKYCQWQFHISTFFVYYIKFWILPQIGFQFHQITSGLFCNIWLLLERKDGEALVYTSRLNNPKCYILL